MKFLSVKAHTIIGIAVGLILLIAPNIFGFNDIEAAALVPRIVGIFIIINELITTSPYSLVKLVPMRVHIAIDVITGLFLALSPWLFGFSDEAANAWVPHVLVGILIMGYALATNVTDDRNASIANE